MVRSAVITCVDVVFEVAAKHNKCNACHKIKYKEQDVEQERERERNMEGKCYSLASSEVSADSLTRISGSALSLAADRRLLRPAPSPSVPPARTVPGDNSAWVVYYCFSSFGSVCVLRAFSGFYGAALRRFFFFSGHALLKNKQYVYDVHTSPQRTKNSAPRAHFQQLIFQGKILC